MGNRTTLNSANTAVIISNSPSFKTVNDSGYIFAGVRSLSYGFNTVRADATQMGSQDYHDENMIRNPDVNIQMSYAFTPTFANEEIMGLEYKLDSKAQNSIFKGLSGASYNFYFYNHPEQGNDALEYLKNGTFPNGGEVVSVGNAYLTNYALNFAVGSFPTVDVEFDCSNIKIENYFSNFIESPAINLESGNNVGVGSINLLEPIYYEPGKFGDLYNLDRSKIETILPYDINFEMDDLFVGGQKINISGHRINNFSLSFPIQRSNLYRLGSDYVCSREIKYPLNGSLSISSLVTNLEAGFLSGLITGDQISNLKIISSDCNNQMTAQFYFEDIKLETIEYQTLVNEQTNYNLEFSFQVNEEKGFKASVSEQDLGTTRFIDSGNAVYKFVIGEVPENWVSGDLNGYKVAFNESLDFNVLDGAFSGCANINESIYFTDKIQSFGDDVFNGCTNLPGFYFDSSCNIPSFGERCFKDCTSLEEIFLPESVLTIGQECFMGCDSANALFLQDVINVGDRAFLNCSGFSESLFLPDTLVNLGESAFENCSNFQGGLYIGESISLIKDKTFKNCENLSFDLTIPDNITEIRTEAFYGCGFDGELSLGSGLTVIEPYTFYQCNSLIGDLVIPENITEVRASAFQGCSGFDGSIFISNLDIIGDHSFSGCSSLNGRVSLKSGIASIGDGAFMNCSSLGLSLDIPSGIQSIGDRAFSGCVGITDVYMNSPASVFQGDEAFAGINGCMYVTPFYYNEYIQASVDGLFQGMPVCYGSLDTVVYDVNTKEVIQLKRGDIPTDWYSNKSTESYLVIGSTATRIESGAFSGSDGIIGLFVVPEELEYIGDYAFKDCSFNGYLEIPDTIEYLGSGAFENCSGFDDFLLIGEGFDVIKGKTFKNCTNLQGDILLHATITGIEEEAFYNCNSISGNLFMGFELRMIGDYAFYNCQNLRGDLEIPEFVTYVGDYAFYNCQSFDGNFINSPVVSYIGNYAFQDCSSMFGPLALPSSVTYLGTGAFKNCKNLNSEINLRPAQIDAIYEETFFGCSGLIGALVIPDKVLSIGDRAFLGCSSLTESITITDIAAQAIGIDAFDTPLPFDELIVSQSVREITQGEFDYFKNDPLFLTLQEGLRVVSGYAFSNYNFIGDLDIPLSLEYVGDAAFSGCTFGGSYLFEDSNIQYIGDYAFYNLNLIDGSLYLPNVEYIGDGAFYNNTAVNGDLTFGLGLTEIGEYAFANCSSATGPLILPDSISGLGQYAFLNCSSLSGEIYLPNNESYNTIKTGTFKNCSALSGDLVVHDYISGIETEAFLGCFGLSGDITITDVCAATLIGTNAFDDSPFKKLIISDSVVNVENTEFDYFSTRQMEVVFQEGLSGILDYAFDNYDFVGELFFPKSLTGIGISAFQNCDGFSGVLTIPEYVESIGVDAFRSCTSLSGNLIIPSQLTNIGDGSFVDCIGLNGYIQISDLSASSISSYNNVFLNTNFTELRASSSDFIIEDTEFDGFDAFVGHLVIMPSASTIGPSAFIDSFSFANTLTISDNNILIDDYAFSGNNFTGDLHIPSIDIGYAAFANCVNFDGRFTMDNITLRSVDSYAFYNCSNLSGELILGPESTQTIGDYSFYNMSSLNEEFALCGLPDDFNGIMAAYTQDDGYEIYVDSALTSFGNYAFADCGNLSGNLVIPHEVTQWGDYAFLNMSGLNGFLIIGSGVNTIPQGIFKNCSNLTCYFPEFEIWPNIDVIEQEAFYNCSSLTCGLRIKPGVTIGNDAFFGVGFSALVVPGYITTVNDTDYDYFTNFEWGLIIENGVQEIGDKAFDDYKFVGELQMPSSLNLIGNSGFKNCYGFSGDLVIPNQVTTLSESVFENCSGFDGNLVLHSNVQYIYDSAFANCTNLNGTLNLYNAVEYIGDRAFANCESFNGNLVIPNSCSGLGEEAFVNCSGFDGLLYISNTLDNIEDRTFQNCTNLTSVLEIPDGVSGVGVAAFQNCYNLYHNGVFEIPESIDYIGDYAFQNCTDLLTGSLQIKGGVDIGVDAFDPFGFDTLVVPDYQVSISSGDYLYFKNYLLELAFENYNSISSQTTTINEKGFYGYSISGSLQFPRNLTVIGSEAFADSPNLDGTLQFNVSIQSIGYRAFANCDSLNGNLIIPNSCTELGEEAFINCVGFNSSLDISDNIEYIEDRTFKNCNNINDILVLPNSASGIGVEAFQDCFNLYNNGVFEIPEEVDSIGDRAFEGCLNLLTGAIQIKGGVDIGVDSFNPFGFEDLIVPDYQISISSGDYEYFKNYPLRLNFENYNSLSNQTTTINQSAFIGYDLNGSLLLPKNLTTIGNDAFRDLVKLSGDLNITTNLQTIGDNAFRGCSGFEGEFSLVTLPGGFNGDTNFGINSNLTTIGDYAFADCINWTGNLVIPDGATYGDYAFENNHSLDGFLLLNKTMTVIPEGAFQDCSGLTCYNGVFEIPQQVTFVERWAFRNCVNLDCALQIGPDVNIGTDAFDGTNFQGLVVPDWVVEIENGDYDVFSQEVWTLEFENYNTSSSTKLIGSGAFDNFNWSGQLLLPTTLTGLGDKCFYQNDKLFGPLEIPLPVKGIGDSAFENCSGFYGEFSFPYNIVNIGDRAFKNCKDLVGHPVFSLSTRTIGDEAFSNCIGLSGKLEMPGNLTDIGSGAFLHCSGISGVLITTLPEATFKGENAFSGVKGILEIGPLVYQDYLNQSTEINGIKYYQGIQISGQVADDTVFYINTVNDEFTKIERDRIESVNFQPYAIPNSWKEGLTSDPAEDPPGTNTQQQYCWLEIGGLCDSISTKAFYNRQKLQGEINIPEGCAFIGTDAFRECKELRFINFYPDSVADINSYAFYGCTGFIGGLEFPTSLNNIQEYAFYNMYNGGPITFSPCDLKTISGYTFYNYGYNVNGNVLTLHSGLENIDTYAFYQFGGTGSEINLPSTLKTIGVRAFEYAGAGTNTSQGGALNGINADSKLESISWLAFRGSRLTGSLVFPPTMDSIGPDAFNDSWITTISGFNDMSNIYSRAFQGSKLDMQELIIGEKPYLDTQCFASCYALRKIVFEGHRPKSGMSEAGHQFQNNQNLYTASLSGFEYVPYNFMGSSYDLRLEEDMFGPRLSGIDNSAFKGCASDISTIYNQGKRSKLYIPSGVKLMEDYCFETNTQTTVLNYSGVEPGTIIGSYAFRNMGSLLFGSSWSTKWEAGPYSRISTYSDGAYISGTDVTGQFYIPSGLDYFGNGAFQNVRGRELEIIFSDDYTGSRTDLQVKRVTGSQAGQYFTRAASTHTYLFYEGWFKKIHLSSGMKRAGTYMMQSTKMMHPSGLDGMDGIEQYDDYCCRYLACAWADPSYTSTALEDTSNVFEWKFGKHTKSLGQSSFATAGLPGQVGLASLPFWYYNENPGGPAAIRTGRCLDSLDFSECSGEVSFGNLSLYRTWHSGELNLPSVSSLGTQVFEGAWNVTRVNFQSSPSLTNLPNATFKDMKSLSGVTFNPELTSIGNSVFELCPSLYEFDISNTIITSIGNAVLKNATNLVDIDLQNGVLTSLGSNVFENCTSIDNLYIPNSVTSVGSNLFLNANINILDYDVNTTTLEAFLFNGATIGTLTLPTTTITVKEGVFSNATFGPDPFNGLPNGVQTFENSIFENVALSGIIIPTSLTGFADFTFKGCTNLTGLDISLCTALTGMGNENFMNCSSLEEIIFNTQLKAMGNRNFVNANQFSGFIGPNDLESIGDENFLNCSGLKKVDLSNSSLITMGDRNFVEDSNLKHIEELYFPDSLEVIGSENFEFQDVDTLKLPTGLRIMGDRNFYDSQPKTLSIYWGEGVPELFTIPSGVESIGNSNFELSDGIQRLRIAETFSGSIGDLNWNLCNQLSKIFIKTTDSNFTIGSGNFRECGLLNEVQIDCPAASWVGLNNFTNTSSTAQYYINSTYFSQYDATWSGEQSIPNGAEFISYSP